MDGENTTRLECPVVAWSVFNIYYVDCVGYLYLTPYKHDVTVTVCKVWCYNTRHAHCLANKWGPFWFVYFAEYKVRAEVYFPPCLRFKAIPDIVLK